jgi:hypothetical protein
MLTQPTINANLSLWYAYVVVPPMTLMVEKVEAP